MKIRSVEELEQFLDDDFAWRRKELTSVFTNVQSSKYLQIKTSLRIGIVMLYAHWEGFIKNAAEYYLIYVATKRLNYSELSNNFIALSLKIKLTEFNQTNKNTIHTQMVSFLLGDLNKRAQIPTENIIKTQSNLNSDILREILSVIGVDYQHYELKEKLIDSQLLKIRNTVAHGQDFEINISEFTILYNEITGLMAKFKNDLSNSATLRTYLK
jgi:hypothetical protein